MPSIDENIRLWGHDYTWEDRGDEWSAWWGGPDMQWFGAFLPRLHAFLPAPSVLEIAPGFGRWTQFLKDQCERLTVVDLNQNCIASCRTRFAAAEHIQYHVNDGKSLAMIADDSTDFVVSLDSLVHAEADAIDAYLGQFPRILKKNGVGVIHHSNFAECVPSAGVSLLLKTPGVRELVHRLDWFREYLNVPGRASSMSARLFAELCKKHGLQCISQEIINWGGKLLNDCISTFTQGGSDWARENRVLRNHRFMAEADAIRALSPLYGWSGLRASGAPT